MDSRSWRRRFLSTGGAIAIVAASVASEAQSLTTTSAGRTTQAASVVPLKQPIIVAIQPAVEVKVCGSSVQPGVATLRYVVGREVVTPRRLPDTEGHVADAVAAGFSIPAQSSDSYVIYNLVRTKVASESVSSCWKMIQSAKGTLKGHDEAVKSAQESLRKANSIVVVAKADLEALRASAALYQGSTTATSQIADLVAQIDKARRAVVAGDESVATATAELEMKRNALSAATDVVEKELGSSVADAELLIRSLAGGSLLKIGAIHVGKNKAVFYDFSSRTEASTLQLMPLGSYPSVRYGDRQAAVIANVQPRTHPYTFFLNATAQDGVVVNTDPVRPTFPVGALEAAATVPTTLVTSEVYIDVVLPVRGSYAPNQYPEVTITTERPSVDDPKKLVAVTLVDKAKFPQFRAMYRYNFNTGVVMSGVQGQTFQKIRTVVDDPATAGVDESRFDVASSRTRRVAKPIFALTYYLKPVDVQGPVSHERYIPNPTIGFGFATPADNVFLGFSHEILRNAQVFWGWHWGVTTELVERNAVTEDRDATAPITRDARERGFSAGVTFNIAIVSKIFK